MDLSVFRGGAPSRERRRLVPEVHLELDPKINVLARGEGEQSADAAHDSRVDEHLAGEEGWGEGETGWGGAERGRLGKMRVKVAKVE